VQGVTGEKQLFSFFLKRGNSNNKKGKIMRIDLQDQFNHNGPTISADHSHQEPIPQAGVAVRLYANQKMGTTFGPGKYRTAIYNATADVLGAKNKYLLDYVRVSEWMDTARDENQIAARDFVADSLAQKGANSNQFIASWIKHLDANKTKTSVPGFSLVDLAEMQLELIIVDPARGIEQHWQLELRPCRDVFGKSTPQLIATNAVLPEPGRG